MSQLCIAGEEIGAVVIQLGTWYFRIGFAGDDSPKLFIRNLYGVSNSESEERASKNGVKEESSVLKNELKADSIDSMNERAVLPETGCGVVDENKEQNNCMEVYESKDQSYFAPSTESPYLFFCNQCSRNFQVYENDWTLSELLREDGLVNDWQALCCLLRESFAFLHIKPEENACMFIEGERGLQPETYSQLARIVFQEFSMRAVFTLNHATAATFASARTTALVVCVGHKGTSVVPVVEGFALNRATVRNRIGGEFLTKIIWKYFSQDSQAVDQEKIQPYGNLDLRSLKVQCLIEDIKHSVCGLWNEKEDVVSIDGTPVEEFRYAFENGRYFRISRELSWKIPFVLFQPSSLRDPPLNGLSFDFLSINERIEDIHQTQGLCDMVVSSVRKCDPDIRRDLLGNILIIGSSTLFPGFTKCFEDMLSEKISPMYRIKTVSVMLPEEKIFASWIGGSIVSSLVTFQPFWFSREEFMKHGAEYIMEKLI